ncbi:putative oxidoreductase [Kineosporia sp. NBRC 101731]|nr:NADP-dependent oxidoreductase [Kineosporia sp. NBRC 101731]GLY32351.1 putative oxidoreductase [Kineosporia sp. NBRC 101731]
MKAVRYDHFGDVDVLYLAELERPVPGPGQVLVEVRATAVNPGEGVIRLGLLADKFPSTFPSGQGSDFAGVVVATGPDAGSFEPGDEVFGYTHDRAGHAEFVLAPIDAVVAKPQALSWNVAGSLYVAGTAAYASVEAVGPGPGDVVVVSGATGGVGSIAGQLARHRGATVIGLASERNHGWLTDHGIVPVAYGEGEAARIQAAADGPITAFIDTYGHGYVDLALDLGVAAERINTVIDFAAAGRHRVNAKGNESATSPEILAELGDLATKGVIEVPISAVYPLSEVARAFQEVEKRHTLGKIVLQP